MKLIRFVSLLHILFKKCIIKTESVSKRVDAFYNFYDFPSCYIS